MTKTEVLPTIQYDIKQISDETKEQYQLGDFKFIKYQILQTAIITTSEQTERRIAILMRSRSETVNEQACNGWDSWGSETVVKLASVWQSPVDMTALNDRQQVSCRTNIVFFFITFFKRGACKEVESACQITAGKENGLIHSCFFSSLYKCESCL